jgi:hypothetical protein
VFSKPLIKIADFSVLSEYNVILFKIMSNQPINMRPSIVRWDILDFSETALSVQLHIDKPELISSNKVRRFNLEI